VIFLKGVLYGVGVGPGDPELLTLKALKIINVADVIIAPRTEKKNESTALSIARPYIVSNTKQIIHQVFPMNRDTKELNDAWTKNSDEIIELLEKGKKVAFLTLGDPMIYSTYIYIYKLIKEQGYRIITIPGVPSFCSVAAKMGIPLAEGNDILSIIPATTEEKYLEKSIDASDNLVLMKVYKNFRDIISKLKKSGHIKNAVMISKNGLNNEKIFSDLTDIHVEKVNYLSTIIAKRNHKLSSKKL
jgi:precorrin-2/cobalt-factor-2 C20-methyltransferase